MRPIDAGAILYMHDCFPSCNGNCMTCESNVVYKGVIDSLDTLDVQEVKHARWVEVEKDVFECSHCERYRIRGCAIPKPRYCGNCGAKMDKEK